jgi:4a-hydroxytetrahydrobiopterin dehydratase
MAIEKLPEDQLLTEVLSLPDWKLIYGGKLLRFTEVKDFVTAFGILTQAALEAEKMGHHPEMRVVYNKVEFILTTHDADGLTELDFQLARKIDEIFRKALAK